MPYCIKEEWGASNQMKKRVTNTFNTGLLNVGNGWGGGVGWGGGGICLPKKDILPCQRAAARLPFNSSTQPHLDKWLEVKTSIGHLDGWRPLLCYGLTRILWIRLVSWMMNPLPSSENFACNQILKFINQKTREIVLKYLFIFEVVTIIFRKVLNS